MVLPLPESPLEVLKRVDLFFGHGRALEGVLVLVKYTYAVMFLFAPTYSIAMVAVTDILDDVPGGLLAFPFLLSASLSTVGLLLNGYGYPICHKFRIWGATVGMMIWIFILIGSYRAGAFWTGNMPWMIWAGIFGSIWIIRRANRGLPVPGALGQT